MGRIYGHLKQEVTISLHPQARTIYKVCESNLNSNIPFSTLIFFSPNNCRFDFWADNLNFFLFIFSFWLMLEIYLLIFFTCSHSKMVFLFFPIFSFCKTWNFGLDSFTLIHFLRKLNKNQPRKNYNLSRYRNPDFDVLCSPLLHTLVKLANSQQCMKGDRIMESCQHPLKSAMRICMIFVLWSITLGWPQEMPPDIRDSKYYTLANIYYG